jgi:hypothetical protein
MVKSAIYEDLGPTDRAYEGFKKNNVLPAHVLFLLKKGDLSRLLVCILHFAAISIHVQKEPVCALCVHMSISVQMLLLLCAIGEDVLRQGLSRDNSQTFSSFLRFLRLSLIFVQDGVAYRSTLDALRFKKNSEA